MNKFGRIASLVASVLMVLSLFSNAETHSTLTDEQFELRLQENPAEAFLSDPIRAWEAIEANPELMTAEPILDAAFTTDIWRAGEFLNTHFNLLSNQIVITKFEEMAQTTIEFINSYPEATGYWLQHQYGLSAAPGASYESYDGTRLTTRGSRWTRFNINDFPNGQIHRDGSLSVGETSFSGTTELSTQTIDGRSTIAMRGGIAESGSGENVIIQVTGGRVEVTDGSDSISGTFTFSRDNGEIRASGSEEFRYHANVGEISRRGERGQPLDATPEISDMRVTGTIIKPAGSRPGEFILEGDATLRFPNEGSQLRVKSGFPNSQVYYTRRLARNAGTFCRLGISCIIDVGGAGNSENHRQILNFQDIGNNIQVSFVTSAYYDHVEVTDNHGQVTVSSVRNNQITGEIVIGEGDNIQARGSNLEQMNVGRIDVMHTSCTGDNDCPLILHHWSSRQGMGAENYFEAAHNQYMGRQQGAQNVLLRCTMGENCEERLARNFGKVIGVPTGGTAQTTIIVAGNNAITARSLESWCQEHGGCNIFNSRDSPEMISSRNLVVTGHHWGNEQAIWRDSPQREPGSPHQQMDTMYFASEPGGRLSIFEELPRGTSVQSIAFSGCNTVVPRYYPGLQALRLAYPSAELIQGWNGIADPYEQINELTERASNIENNAYAWQGSRRDRHGQRSWYIPSGFTWLWTADGRACYPLGSSERQDCPGIATTIASR